MESYFKKRYNSFRFAFRGIAAAIRSEPHMRLHFLAALGVTVAGFLFDITRWEWCLLILSMGLVIVSEIINTAIETLTNLVSPEWNELAGKTKDLAAGAVLVAAFTAALVGAVVFVPYVLQFLDSYL
ncbi:diacylglycerol kinase family protein [Pontibacter arcticus]|uniref:Diacylglycerol kinase family protein n=1 Tax=Pontibacter arcticus TaxID=2080288 RepID=A0A364RJ50_9BACT|nr:diacylglycerol kinase family protein [Pontibacter arcticus]RAU84268.1 diacylglycerol kinase family protein [Pontibacter arcticus]